MPRFRPVKAVQAGPAMTAALTALLWTLFEVFSGPAFAAPAGVTFFTPYTDVAVTPGETITYSIEIKNATGEIRRMKLAAQAPSGWETNLTAGGYKIQEIAVRPNDSETVTFTVDVPLKIDKGTYRVALLADGAPVLPLFVNVTEQGTYQAELSTDQPNMEGTNKSTFNYELKLKNRTPDAQTFALRADAEAGWNVQFTVEGNDVTSVSVDPGGQKTIRVSINPPSRIEAGTYKIPVRAETKNLSAETTLEVVIRGTYGLKLTTPDEVLSTSITAGGERRVKLRVENTGSAPLAKIQLSADTPVGWDVKFDPETIDTLAPNETKDVTATIRADKKAIAGDYVVTMNARTPEAEDSAAFRVTVKTSLLWGVVAVLIIGGVLAGLYALIQRYGRR
ncbi:NEW3 domain-containing protein [Hydrogenibacillus schlegelii]|uniref:Alpha-galactosidase NEW3 domain-containing protein n=1 Tax=Hydrogenibacillus schlegelii TaxID=1484 RepID=A0A179IS09_HYDSH|nr:NEW3 domain-containing protein [Hydrogenibacillus schlegelii]OAR04612.1 hypothetical protein SA87_08715 [Hydrogenibacillus schlegelii]